MSFTILNINSTRSYVVKKILEKLKSVNLTIPILIVLLGIFITSIYLADYYGVTNIAGDKEEIVEEKQDEEINVENKNQTEPDSKFNGEESTEPKEPETKIVFSLTGKSYENGVKLTWNTSGINTKYGYKIVKSTNLNPVYPGSDYRYISNSAQNSYTWELKDGKTYYFRICQYLENRKCGYYSNNLKLTAPLVKDVEESSVKSINLSFVNFLALSEYNMDALKETTEPNTKQAKVSWNVDGYSKNGFKLVWSKTSGPTYPKRTTDKYAYYSNPNTTYGILNNFDSNGKYYVRVCEYLGGKCGVYSNQIEITFE